MFFGSAALSLRRVLPIGAAALVASLAAPASRAQDRGSPAPSSPIAPPIDQAVLLEGRPFPAARGPAIRLPQPKRTFFVAPGNDAGDGTESRPWSDLRAALPRLAAGDRLRVRAGTYGGPVTIGEGCADGNERDPIQLVFDGKAEIEPGADSPALVVERANWVIVGPYVKLRESKAPGILFRGRGAHDVRLDGARVADGLGPGIRIEAETARVAISGAYVSKSHLKEMGRDSCGVYVAGGAREVSVEGSRFSNNPSGSIRVRAADSPRTLTRDVQIRSNTIRDDGATAISIETADGVIIANNTLVDATGTAGTRGVLLERVERASVRTNRIAGFATGVAVGRADPQGGPYRAARDVTVERNFLENREGAGAAAFVVEAATGARIVNNLTEGYANGVLVFGAPPQTERVVVANNVFLRVADVAFMMQNPSAASFFDFNVFSPASPVTVEIAGKPVPLARYLKGGTMPNTQVKTGVRITNRDLGRLSGLPTVDRGKAVEGLQFRGAAPDLGVAER